MASAGRLKKRFEYLAVRNADVCVPTKGFILQLLVRQTINLERSIDFRLGLTVSKRVGNAVCRNRVKRRLREVVQEALPFLPLNASYDVVLIGRQPAFDCAYGRLLQDFKKAFMKALSATKGKEC